MKDEINRVGVWISILYRCRKSYIMKSLEGHGALGSLYMIVLAIDNHRGGSQEQISAILKIDKACITRSVQKLEAEGYVTRKPDPLDKRANKLYLTAKAENLIPSIRAAIDAWERLIIADAPGDVYDLIIENLEQMADKAYRISNGDGERDPSSDAKNLTMKIHINDRKGV